MQVAYLFWPGLGRGCDDKMVLMILGGQSSERGENVFLVKMATTNGANFFPSAKTLLFQRPSGD